MRQWRSRKKTAPRTWVRKPGERRGARQKGDAGKHMSMSVKCMIFHDGRLLLLQKKDRENVLPWEFPGGGLEFGEDLAQAAHREVREETGLSITLGDIAGLWSYARSPRQFLTGVIYFAEAETDAVQLSQEHVDYVWVHPSELADYHLQPSLRAALDAIAQDQSHQHNVRTYFTSHYTVGVEDSDHA